MKPIPIRALSLMTRRMTERRTLSFKNFIVVISATVVMASCATPGSRQTLAGEETITAEMVLVSSPLAESATAPDTAAEDILALSPEMRAFLDEHVNREGNQNERLAQLLYSIIGEDRFLLSYDDSTRTAESTFESRRGNCISFTNMFVAMARDINLDASYQEVDIPPDWSMTGETYLLSQHVNALVDMKSALSRVVDFNTIDYNTKNEMREITDDRARAHYYNNIGVERMLVAETSAAYANLRRSLNEDRTFSSAWVNMGILHRREGYPAYAEAAYLKALDYHRSDLMAMSNLASLYEEEGKSEQAGFYLSKVRSHRMRNPYYRYQLANTAFNDGDYREAISNLKMAIRQRKDEDHFYYLLSLSYLMSGDKEEAERWMKKAEEVAEESEDQKKYHHKLDLLKSQQSGF